MLDAYFNRIGYAGPREPTASVLAALHARHPAAIPFEGLDPFLGRPVAIDPASIAAKLIHGGRGGYCYEQNALFHDVLAALGFAVRPLAARVLWMRPEREATLTHRLTLVDMPDGPWIADVGFGGQGPTLPLRLGTGAVQDTPHGAYRVVASAGSFTPQLRVGARWEPVYRFTLEPQGDADFTVANWFTSTYPRAMFVANLVACRVVGDRRVNLLNTTLTIRDRDGAAERRMLTGPAELREVLEDTMGLTLPVSAQAIWERLPA